MSKQVYCGGENTGCDHEDKPTLVKCADCPYLTTIKPEQDELLLAEIGKMLYFEFEEYEVGSVAEVTWRENPFRQKEFKKKAKKLLAKVKQHYEQSSHARGEPLKALVSKQKPIISGGFKSIKVGIEKRLDRPDREKIAEWLESYHPKRNSPTPNEVMVDGQVKRRYLRDADKLLALIPDIEEIKSQYYIDLENIGAEIEEAKQIAFDKGVKHGTTIRNLNWNSENHQRHGRKMAKAKEEAKKQAVDFIESYLVTTVHPEGNMHHIDDKEWQSVKLRVLRQSLKEIKEEK